MSEPVALGPAEFRAAVGAAARAEVRKYLEENPPGAAPEAAPAHPAEPVHADAQSFYVDYFSPIFARDPGAQSFKWCSAPFEHHEFTEVMTVLWQSWEFLRANDPAMGIPVWFRDWAYPLMERLSAIEGTFIRCTRKEGGHDDPVTIRPLAEVIPR